MTDQTRKVVERARQLVWMVREGRDTSVYKSSLDYAKTLIEMDSEVRRLRGQVEAQRQYLKHACDALDGIVSRSLDEEPLTLADQQTITKLVEEANRLLKAKAAL